MTVRAQRSDARREIGLLEREEALARVEDAIERACAGKGGLQLIEGPAGVGKSALLNAAGEIGAERGMTLLAARTTEMERDMPFGAVRQLLEGHLRSLPSARLEELFAGSAAPAAAVLGFAAPGGSPAPSIPAMYGLHWLVANLAESAPLLLLLDDAHLADADTARFLGFMAPRLPELPVLLLVAARSDDPGAALGLAGTASDPAARPIVPGLLSADACATVAAAVFDAPVEPALARACHQASGGNPFYLWALLEQLRREGDEPSAATVAKALSLGPQSVIRVIVARIGRLPAAAAAVARAAAVLGDDASPQLVASLAGVSRAEHADAVDGLRSAAVFGEGQLLTFAHPIVRNAVYADMGPGERAGLHRRAADLLEAEGVAAERIAAHLLTVDPAGAASVVDTLRTAAADAIGRGAPAAAVTYLRRALREPPPRDSRDEVVLDLGRAELTTDGEAARDHLREALDSHAGGEGRIAVVRSLAAAHLTVGEVDRLSSLLRDEIEAAAAIGPDAAAPLESDLVMALLTGADGASVREAHERVERLAPTLTGSTVSGRALLSCLGYSRLCRGLPADEVIEPLRLRLAQAAAAGGDAVPSADWAMALGVLLRCGELDAAEDAARRGVEAAKQSGSLYALAGAHWVLGVAAQYRGQLREASSRLEVAIRSAREFGAIAGVHASLVSLVAVEVERGELDAASSALASEGLDRGPVEQVSTPGELLESRARLRLAQGDASSALEDFERVADIARERGDLGPGMTSWRSGAALARLRLGDRGAARSLAAEELRRARVFGEARTLGGALVVAARIEEGEDAVALLREAAALLDGSPFRIEQGHALVEYGAALRRRGERTSAREPLRAGLDLARSAGATPLAERAFEELQATGARPRKVLRTGVDTLTPSEARVARLAASGMSNREIAQELFLSPRTVEFHLRQVFVKLEISSRARLSDALGE